MGAKGIKFSISKLNQETIGLFKSWWETSTYCETDRCSTSCSIVSYIFYGQPIRYHYYRHCENACHIREAP
jgi:hypothetical protein